MGKTLNIDKYKPKVEEHPTKEVKNPKKHESSNNKVMLVKTTSITDEDGNEMAISDWHESLEDGESIQVHCPISPESHSNGDANPSCTMKRNGDYLNLNCFGCGQSAYHTTVKNKVRNRDKKDFDYTVPPFDKEKALKSVRKNLVIIDDIVAEIIRFLPPLEKKLKEEK